MSNEASALRQLLFGVGIGVGIGASLSLAASLTTRQEPTRRDHPKLAHRPIEIRSGEVLDGVTGLIGNTPLVRIKSLSDALGVTILAKAELLNPGGSVKDRVALRIIQDAEQLGLLVPNTGSRIFEGTVGSTGISIATVARARGYDTTIIMPDDVAAEKVKALEALGATVERVRPVSIVDKKQYVNLARKAALEFGTSPQHNASNADRGASNALPIVSTSELVVAPAESNSSSAARGFFADQFENKSNYDAHFEGTGPEIWSQTNGHVDAFISGAGTGGTIAGVGRYLKSMSETTRVVLADPQGSGLCNKVKYGVLFDEAEREGTKRRHQVDTVVEGIGINRLTQNINLALPIIDDAFRISDAEAVSMARYLVQHDGFFLGSSSACNLVACVKLVKKMGWCNGERVVTIMCDSGTRHYSKFWNDDYLRQNDIPIDASIVEEMLGSPSKAQT